MRDLGAFMQAAILVLFVSACSQPADVPPTATEAPAQLPTATSLPTDTAVPPTATITPIPQPELVFRDDFNGTLGEGWMWLREVTDFWSLDRSPGYLQIRLQPGSLGLAYPKNLLLRDAPGPHYRIITSFKFDPKRNYQFAGLLVYQDDENAVQFGRAFCNAPNTCVGSGLYFDNINETFSGTNFATQAGGTADGFLRLTRDRSTYTAEYSNDGTDWIFIGKHEAFLADQRIGLIAAQGPQSAIAEFDFFEVYSMPD